LVTEVPRQPKQDGGQATRDLAGYDLGGSIGAAVVDQDQTNPVDLVGGEVFRGEGCSEARQERGEHLFFVPQWNDHVEAVFLLLGE
jgi:hypothetical protein